MASPGDAVWLVTAMPMTATVHLSICQQKREGTANECVHGRMDGSMDGQTDA